MILDVLLLGFAGYGFLTGFKEGIINSVFSILSIIIALMAAFKLSSYMTSALSEAFNIHTPLMFIVGFLVTFFLSKWLLKTAATAVTAVMETVHVNLLNQIVGGTVVSLFFAFIYSLMVWFGESAHVINPNMIAESRTYPFLQPLRDGAFAVFGKAKPVFQGFLHETDKALNTVEDKQIKRAEAKTDIYDIPTNNNNSQNPTPR